MCSWMECSFRHRGDSHYALASIVPSSMPPRVHNFKDTLRLYASLGCLALLLGLSAAEVIQLLPLSMLLALFLVAIKCITLDQAWRAINYRVLLTICCSFGVGAALQNTHVSAIIASALAVVGHSAGGMPCALPQMHMHEDADGHGHGHREHGCVFAHVHVHVLSTVCAGFVYLCAVFFVTSILSCVVSNSATGSMAGVPNSRAPRPSHVGSCEGHTHDDSPLSHVPSQSWFFIKSCARSRCRGSCRPKVSSQ